MEDDELLSFEDPSVTPAFDPNDKTERFDPDPGSIWQITFEQNGAVPRKRHYGRRYEETTRKTTKLSDEDVKRGLVILPSQKTGEPAVFAPATEGKEKWGYRRCMAFTGYCPACLTKKLEFSKKDKRRVQGAADIFGTNLYVWLTDEKGNLLDKTSKRPIDCDGKFIELDEQGVWDQETFVDTEEVGIPTGKVMFYQFGADKFVQVRQIMRTTKKAGPFKHLNILFECTDANFKKASMQPMLHAMSAANTRRPQLDEEFRKRGIKKLGVWLCKEISPNELVYFFGLEQNLLQEEEEGEEGSSHGNPPEDGEDSSAEDHDLETPDLDSEEPPHPEEADHTQGDDVSEPPETETAPANQVSGLLDEL